MKLLIMQFELNIWVYIYIKQKFADFNNFSIKHFWSTFIIKF